MYPYDFGNSFGNFNNFNPYTMGNFCQNSNAYGQQFQNGQNQQTQQSVGCGLDIVTVQTVQQVDQVQVNPAQRRLVMVQNEPVVAMRSADNMGSEIRKGKRGAARVYAGNLGREKRALH